LRKNRKKNLQKSEFLSFQKSRKICEKIAKIMVSQNANFGKKGRLFAQDFLGKNPEK
jgi:hypothetical protein